MSTDQTEPQVDEAAPVMIETARIHRNPEWQVRVKMDAGTVTRYAEAMEAGKRFPPVHLADLDGTLWLVDGWHRMAAVERLRWPQVAASVVTKDADRARWLAVVPNLEHGLALTRADKRNVFRAYVMGKQHRQGRKVKTSRAMSDELGRLVSHATVIAWMKSDFPSVYRAMTLGGEDAEKGGLYEQPDPDTRLAEAARGTLGQLRETYRDLKSPEARGTLIADVQAVLTAMREQPGWTPRPPSDPMANPWNNSDF